MNNIKSINEFFGGEEFDISGLSIEDISKLSQYAYNIASAFDTANKYSGTEKHTLPLMKSIKENNEKFKDVLEKLEKSSLMIAPKTKN